jgi:uncharacterized protein (DUF1778 family)
MRRIVDRKTGKTSKQSSKTTEIRQETSGQPRRARSERLNARITPGDQALLAKVAGMQGVSVSTFVIQAARERAKALLRRRSLIRVSARDQKALISALLSPPEPNAALVRAAASHARELARRAASETLESPKLAQ